MVIAKAVTALHPDWQQDEATTADGALALAQTVHIDIALMDYNMPGRDGLTLATDLRDQYPLMPLALITANTQMENYRRRAATRCDVPAEARLAIRPSSIFDRSRDTAGCRRVSGFTNTPSIGYGKSHPEGRQTRNRRTVDCVA
jgi:CheY-like chemotaxis protein